MSELPATSGHSLPLEITEAILTLLPPKSLGRFKSVSKRWKSLISDPQFIKNHLLHTIHCHQTSKLILFSDTKSLYSADASEFFQWHNNEDTSVTVKEMANGQQPSRWKMKQMLGSCNGLVLAKDINNTIYLMNPSTQERWEVPLSPFTLPWKSKYHRDLYGFCYDSLADDYIVIVISVSFSEHRPDCIDTFVSVYSLRNNLWRQFPKSPFEHTSIEISGVFINHKFYWSATASTVVAFSLADEEFTEIKLPDAIAMDADWFSYLVIEVGGKLVIFGSRECYELLVMEEEWWTRVCSVGHEIEIDPFSAVCLVEGSKRIIVLDNEEEGGFVVYHIHDGRYGNVRIVGAPSGSTFVVRMYLETLESPRRITLPP